MIYDLIVSGGLIVDGTGSEPYEADLAIQGDRIVEIGTISAESQRRIDAENHIVTPGFIDLHTHLDAQIGWDPMLTPLSWHGVTTAILGNCGVTFAPCKPADREFLAGMMETVEDIPKQAILDGLSWNWENYGEYLDELKSLNPVINVGGLVGHCAVRFYVMGERGIEEDSTEDEKQEMAELVRQAIKDGAVGFSSSRNPGHRIPDGRSVPGTYAPHEELVEIAKAVGGEGALMQNVMNMSNIEEEMELLKKEAGQARVLFSHYTGGTSSFGDKIEAKVMSMRGEGLDVSGMIIPRASGFLSGLQGYPLWRGGPWDELNAMMLEERLLAIRDEKFSRRLVEYSVSNDPIIAAEYIYPLGDGDKPNYIGGAEESLKALADAAGEHPSETFIRMSSRSEGKALFTLRALNRNMDALSKAISSEFCLPGLGDAGAHVSEIMDSGWATFTISYWHRDTNLLSLSEVVRQLTSAPGRIIGLNDRGTLERGKKADLNVINLGALSERMPEFVYDLPGGARRLTQKALGYRATICNGVTILENDQHTGSRAGSIVRHGSVN